MEQREINRLHAVHFGKLLNNYTILGGILLFLIALFPFATLFYFLILAVIILFMLVTGLLFTGDYDFNSVDFINSVYEFLKICLPYIFGVTAVCAVLSIVFLSFDRNSRHVGRIVFAVIALVIGVFALLMCCAGGTKA